jgi:hypothetical protein
MSRSLTLVVGEEGVMGSHDQVLCPDCDALVDIRFILATDKGFGRCARCYEYAGDHRSVRAVVKIPTRVWESAVLADLPVCTVGGK